MPSSALNGLLSGLQEVAALQRANPMPSRSGGIGRHDVVRALGRSSAVLLTSHFERFIRALNEEAIGVVTAAQPIAATLSEDLRLYYSKSAVDELAEPQWDRRAGRLRTYSEDHASLWMDTERVTVLSHKFLLAFMKSPKPDNVRRYFRMWGFEDIFRTITRTPPNALRIELNIKELVEKRNNIAHGDLAEEALPSDIVRYRTAVRDFAERVDRRFGAHLGQMCNVAAPW